MVINLDLGLAWFGTLLTGMGIILTRIVYEYGYIAETISFLILSLLSYYISFIFFKRYIGELKDTAYMDGYDEGFHDAENK